MTEVPPGNSITRLQLILTKALQGQATVLTGGHSPESYTQSSFAITHTTLPQLPSESIH